MEPIRLPTTIKHNARKPWAIYGDKDSRKNLITSIYMNPKTLSALNIRLQDKYQVIEQELVEFEEIGADDAEVLLVAYGISARICSSAIKTLRYRGIKAGIVRPKTLFPFPRKRLRDLASRIRACIVAELSNGQMAEDVERAIEAQCPIIRYNWFGGMIPSINEIVERVSAYMSGRVK
jgi:2-oxoisovalerate ferredoxin oxidoreductase alpha subunit